MDNCELAEKWISVFGEGVDKNLINDHVTSYGNHLWHLFTWAMCLVFREMKQEVHLMFCSI